MRIVGGKLRGMTLADPGAGDPKAHLRPTSDRVREAMFNLLAHGNYGIPPPPSGRRVLDLFSGTGALAIEALSRGAVHATCVDNGRTSLSLMRQNLKRLPAETSAICLARDATRLGDAAGAEHDLVFLDPPYGQEMGEAALQSARSGGWLSPRALVVWEEAEDMPGLDGFVLRDSRRYGQSVITFLERTEDT